jgi:hypothetical protein
VKLELIGTNKVQSDLGFFLWMRNPFQLHYSEGERELIVTGEMLTGETELLVSSSAIRKWKPPYDCEIIDSPKKEEIVSNISAALRFLGIRFEFD